MEAIDLVSTIVSGAILALVCYVAKTTVTHLKDFMGEHEELIKAKENLNDLVKALDNITQEIEEIKKNQQTLMESQRNQLKERINAIYQTAKHRGFITHLELEAFNRLGDSYFALEGNSYIHSIVKKANLLPVGDEEIPTD